ncbi:MAG: thermostable hemolysin [Xanthomonadales bacterium]|nr:thermostable hemolysin [Xanthomonadales bacterium]
MTIKIDALYENNISPLLFWTNHNNTNNPHRSTQTNQHSLKTNQELGIQTPFARGLQLNLLSPVDEQRKSAETFINAGYAKHFGAHLAEFSPIILTVKDFFNNRILGAVGLRYADGQSLFSENYLSEPIESLLSEKTNQKIKRKQVIELSHFVVDKNTDVNVVFPMIGQFLKTLDVDWAVYTLSRPIKSAFQRLGIQLTHLQHAYADAIKVSKTNWGHYYDFKPAVYFSSILENMNA